jgi:hypothetical protein
MLARTDQLKADDLKRCQAAFDALDADGSGTLDMANPNHDPNPTPNPYSKPKPKPKPKP